MHLLRVDKLKRARIGDIVGKFTELDRDCHQLSNYCTARTKQPSRTDSGLSEIVELSNSPGKEFTPPMRSETWPVQSRPIGGQSKSGRPTKGYTSQSYGVIAEDAHSKMSCTQNGFVESTHSEGDVSIANDSAISQDVSATSGTLTGPGLGIVHTPTARVLSERAFTVAERNMMNGDRSHVVGPPSESPPEPAGHDVLRHAPRREQHIESCSQAADVRLHDKVSTGDRKQPVETQSQSAPPGQTTHPKRNAHWLRKVQIGKRRSNLTARWKEFKKKSAKRVHQLVDRLFGAD